MKFQQSEQCSKQLSILVYTAINWLPNIAKFYVLKKKTIGLRGVRALPLCMHRHNVVAIVLGVIAKLKSQLQLRLD
jgi:hypothetical protein